jgi:outer membrane cobalamin receptor
MASGPGPCRQRRGGVAPAIDMRLDVAAISESLVVTAAAVEAPRSSSAASTMFGWRPGGRGRRRRRARASVAGFTVTSNGAAGAVTSSFTRGGESDYTPVVVDGIRMNTFGGGLDRPSAHRRRPSASRSRAGRRARCSAPTPSAASTSCRTRGPLTASVTGDAGSFDAAHIGVRQRIGRALAIHASGDYTDSQGWNDASLPGGAIVRTTTTRAAPPAGATWTGHRGTLLRGVLQRRTSTRGNPGPFGSDPNGTFSGIDRVARGTTATTGVAGAVTQRFGTRWQARLDGTAASLDSGYANAFGTSIMATTRRSGRGQVDAIVSGALAASAGIELLDEQAVSTYITGPDAAVLPIDRRVTGSFGEVRFDTGGRLFAAAGVRAEHLTRRALGASVDPFSPRPAFDADTVTSWNPKLSASYVLVPMRDGRTFRRAANAGTGIRPPDAFEIAFTDNPSLAPERSRSLDVGVEQWFASGRVALEATYFHNRYDDLIVAVGRAFANASRYRTDNIANARARGVEVSGSLRTSSGVGVRAGYTWLDSEVLAVDAYATAPSPFAVGDRLLRRPRHQGVVEATLVRAGFSAFVRTLARGDVLDVDPSWRVRRHAWRPGMRTGGRGGAPPGARRHRGVRPRHQPVRSRAREVSASRPRARACWRTPLISLTCASHDGAPVLHGVTMTVRPARSSACSGRMARARPFAPAGGHGARGAVG